MCNKKNGVEICTHNTAGNKKDGNFVCGSCAQQSSLATTAAAADNEDQL